MTVWAMGQGSLSVLSGFGLEGSRDAGGKKKTRTQPQDDRGGFLVWDGKPRRSLKMTTGFSKHIRYIGIDYATELFNRKYTESNDEYLLKYILEKNLF